MEDVGSRVLGALDGAVCSCEDGIWVAKAAVGSGVERNAIQPETNIGSDNEDNNQKQRDRA
jgi:hypothetical protein